MKRKPIMYAAIALVLSARIFADMQTDLIPLTVKLGNKVEQTGGFFDLAGATYPSKAQVITISDETHPNPVKKRQAFTRAISGDKSKVILLEGTIDLSDGKISDSDHSYYDAFDKTTHKRLHADIVFDIGSNTTILGTKNARIAFGGLRIKASEKQKAENIIIRNVEFYDAHGSTEYDTSDPEYKNERRAPTSSSWKERSKRENTRQITSPETSGLTTALSPTEHAATFRGISTTTAPST